ncbi:restriction endonuclease subunit S [Treponema denticola]|uniref:restriction endonuclease subunit S n=1 Tax=Treponema denticola TaxID=158 RepID=UPI002102B89A|nr:restriction endonuclease subunit S [Treponema denticola]
MPEGWAWASLSEIANIYTGNSINENEKNKKYSNVSDGLFYIATKDIDFEGVINYENGIKIPFSESKFKIAPAQSSLICIEGGSAGRKIGFINKEVCFVNKLCCLHCEFIDNLYLFYYLRSSTFIDFFNVNKSGLIGGVSLNLLKRIPLPLPPLAEQKCIVTVIETIFAQIDLLEQNKADLQTAIKQAKSKILDLAIRGKLVPQDSADEPASVMLEKLRAEKEAKIASGEIKRGKNDSYIYKNSTDNCYYQKYADGCEENISDEIPFAVPEGWTWCRLGEISEFLSRGKTPVYTKESQYPVLAQKCNQWDGIRLDKVLFLDPNSLSKWTNEYHLQHEDIVINSTGTGTIGRVGIFDIGILGKYPFIVPDSHISIVRCYKAYIYQKYIYAIFTSEHLQNKINKAATGSTNQKELPKNILIEFFLPLPPLVEQKRIVAKIEELFAQLDFITTALVTTAL